MITAIVNFDLPEDITAERAREMFEASAPRYETVPGLVRKYYLCDPESRTGGGVYLWADRESAEM
ncbi:MAG: YdhR family protein, partial [Alphaproteobacteria bacterium]|nr:YdhR family protein [Alphaproteobacteria bacterium]